MVDFAAKDLGRALGKMSQEQARIQENIYPDDPDSQLLLQVPETLLLSEEVTLTRKDYADNVFVLGHPVYGDLGSSVLMLGGGYAWENYGMGVVSHYSFTNNVLDDVGSFNGTATSLTYSSGLIGSAGVFNGTTSKVAIGASSSMITSSRWSIAAWAYATSLASSSTNGNPNRIICFHRSASASTAFAIGMCSDVGGKVVFSHRDSGGTEFFRRVSTVALNAWHHVVATYDGSTFRVYHNGVQVDTWSNSLASLGTFTAIIGSFDTIAYFSGLIDGVGIWNDRVLSSGEVSNLYNSGSGRAYDLNNLSSSILQVI